MKQNVNQDVLTHHGIKGQRWGIRRYQNKDGSLTAAGRRRASRLKDEYTQLTGKKLIRKPTSKEEKLKNLKEELNKKSVKDLTDAELKDRINRLQMEKQATQLQKELSRKGDTVATKLRKEALIPAATEATKRVLTDAFTKIGKQVLHLSTKNTLKEEVENLELEKRKLSAQEKIDQIIERTKGKKLKSTRK